MAFQACGIPLVVVIEFKCLRRVLSASDDDWPAVVGNVRKARKGWAMESMILGSEREDPHTSGNFYKAVVQAKLLFGAKSWVKSPRIGRTLGGFHHRVARRRENIQSRRTRAGRWIYPPLDAAMQEMDLEEMETYVFHHQNTATQYITT